jgi:simple sugar transport system permease protein
VHHKIVSGFPAGYGFTGIAVALMGRNHPIGIFSCSVSIWNFISRGI